MLLLLSASITVKDPHGFHGTARTIPECENLIQQEMLKSDCLKWEEPKYLVPILYFLIKLKSLTVCVGVTLRLRIFPHQGEGGASDS